MADDAVRTVDLTCNFKTLCAVDSLSITVPRGIIFGFLGPNGAGKTTTVRMLLGLLEPSGGYGEVLGFDISRDGQAIREQTGALLEHNGLYERMTAEENLEYFGRIFRLTALERRNRIRELLTHAGLWDRRRELVGTWSKGMRQRLAVIRTMLHRPPLVFLDEPTSGLDPLAAIALRNDFLKLKAQEGTTVFLNTHNLSEAEKMCDLVGIIRGGRLLKVAPPKELMENGSQPRLEITGSQFTPLLVERLTAMPGIKRVQEEDSRLRIDLSTRDTDVNAVIALVAQSGANIETVIRGMASLEEAFADLVQEEGKE